ncbi:MAG TPA: hypothetical protein VME68_11665 [Acidobacteriaceae bacterium]|nr:hypothetical protein [Acidobacteriaceae bacterium]
MNGEFDRETSAPVDAALRAVGSATPEPGFEGRILTRLAQARAEGYAAPRAGSRLMRVAAPGLGFVCASLLCAVIVTGSVRFSHRNHPGSVAPPTIQMQGTGVGAASAVHPAAPASTPMPAGTKGRSARRTVQGRARIAPQARKAPGVAVPAPTANVPQN